MVDFNESSPTFRLCALPTFLTGMAMALDYAHVFPVLNWSKDAATADHLATASDWRAVADDMRAACGKLEAN